MTQDKVDVLIVGSGASGAAVAWSLADTKMRILCLEQGDWVKPTDYPTNGRDWEARLFGDFAINPNRRARDTDYPINNGTSPIQVVNFNGVGGSTIMYTAHYPRLHPSDFRVKSARRRGRRLARRLRHARAVLRRERPHDRRRGPRRRSRLSVPPAADAAAAARQDGQVLRRGAEQARLALVAVGLRDRHHRVRRPRRLHQSRPLHAGLRAGRQVQRRHHLLAARHPRRRRAAHALPGARDHGRARRHGERRDLLRRRRQGAVPAGRDGDRGLQRHRHAAADAELAFRAAFPTASPIRAGSWART